MRHFILVAALLSGSLSAQVTHTVLVGGSTLGPTLPYYDPQTLTINVGDIVEWENQSGTHNVNGSTTLFPANPEGFSSGQGQSGNWTFSHTFNIAGTYNYHCTQDGHSATQFGTITVLNGQMVEELAVEDITLFPVPATDHLVIDLGKRKIASAQVIGIDGKTYLNRPLNGSTRMELDISTLSHGQYYLRLIDEGGMAIIRPFRKI